MMHTQIATSKWGTWGLNFHMPMTLPTVFPMVPLLVATHPALLKTEAMGCSRDGNNVVLWSGNLKMMQ